MLGVQNLRGFSAVMEAGTVTAAALVLGRTQPQVSRMIASLEGELGFKLFERERRRLVPTERGVSFYEEVRRALDGLDHVGRVAERIRTDAEAELRILAPPYVAHTILPHALATFRARYPARRFSVEILVRSTIGSWIANHPFDIGIAALPFELRSIRVTRLASAENVVVLPKRHPLAAKKIIKSSDLAGYPFIAMSENTPHRRMLDEAVQRDGVELTIVGQTSTSISACEMVAQGLGLTIADVFVPMAFDPKLVDYRLWRPGLRSEFGLIYPAAAPGSAAVRDFAAIVEELVAAADRKFVTPLK